MQFPSLKSVQNWSYSDSTWTTSGNLKKMSSENVAIKTVFKMFDIPLDGKLSREDYERYAEHERDVVKLLNPAEAETVLSMSTSDMLGLDKYAKDGGMSYTVREFEIAWRVAARKELPEANQAFHQAYFRVIDTNGDHFLEKSEWTYYLKMCKTYTSEEQAMQALDSIDKNKDGVTSLQEYVDHCEDFWCNLGEKYGAQNLYGPKNLWTVYLHIVVHFVQTNFWESWWLINFCCRPTSSIINYKNCKLRNYVRWRMRFIRPWNRCGCMLYASQCIILMYTATISGYNSLIIIIVSNIENVAI